MWESEKFSGCDCFGRMNASSGCKCGEMDASGCRCGEGDASRCKGGDACCGQKKAWSENKEV